MAHSTFSASAAPRWLACPGSVVLSDGKPDTTSRHAAEGTVAHLLLEEYLTRSTLPEGRVGEVITQDGHDIVVDQDMAASLRVAIDHIDEMTKLADIRQAETRVNYAAWLGVPADRAWGTADLIAVFSEARELLVGDLKFGRGVEVSAVENEQMMLYAGGALLQMDALGVDIETIRLVIFQPRISRAPSEWAITTAELEAWLTGRARSGASSVQMAVQVYPDAAQGATDWHQTFLRPGEAQCRWCKAKATCPALRDEVLGTSLGTAPATVDEFEAVMDTRAIDAASLRDEPEAWLAACLSKVDLIEDWCKAVRAEVERRLLAGEPVPGFKVVAGKKGARAWADPAAAEKLLRETFRLPIEKAYDLKLISPTSAEKLAKVGEIGPRQWPKAANLITQSEGKPHVAPVSDPRPAITVQPVAKAFEVQAGDLV